MPIPLILPLLAAAKLGRNIVQEKKQRDYMDAQKGLLEAQIKQLKANEERLAAQDAFMQTLSPENRIAFRSKDPLETWATMQLMGGTRTQAPTGPTVSSAPPAQAPASAPMGGISGMSPQQIAEQLFRKKLGRGEEKLMQREVVNPQGQRGTAVYNLTTGQPNWDTFVPEKPERDRIEVTKGGKTYYQYVDPQTQQQVGEPMEKESQKEKGLGGTDANTIALTKNSLRDAQTAINALFSDGSPDTIKLMAAKIEAPGTKAREFSQAWDRAVKPLMVALTGTGMSEREAANIIGMSKPQIGDNSDSIKNKVESLVNFMQERLKLMDPNGQYGIVNISLPWNGGGTGREGAEQKKPDFVFVPGRGLVPADQAGR